MEEADVLEALSDVLERLTINPYDLSLHAEHIRIAQATGMQDQLISALDMMTAYWAVGDQLWLLLIQPNLASIPETVEELKSLLTLFQRAEEDYLCEYFPLTLQVPFLSFIQLFHSSRCIWSSLSIHLNGIMDLKPLARHQTSWAICSPPAGCAQQCRRLLREEWVI